MAYHFDEARYRLNFDTDEDLIESLPVLWNLPSHPLISLVQSGNNASNASGRWMWEALAGSTYPIARIPQSRGLGYWCRGVSGVVYECHMRGKFFLVGGALLVNKNFPYPDMLAKAIFHSSSEITPASEIDIRDAHSYTFHTQTLNYVCGSEPRTTFDLNPTLRKYFPTTTTAIIKKVNHDHE